MNDQGDHDEENVLEALTGAQQRWIVLCRRAVVDGGDATAALMGDTPETRVLAQRSRATWRRTTAEAFSSLDEGDLLELEAEFPDPGDARLPADLSAARATAAIANALTGAMPVDEACAVFLAHTERAGLHSTGTQLMPASAANSDNESLNALILALLGHGGAPARGYGILVALELAVARPPRRRSTHTRVLFATYSGRGGEVGTLRLEQLKHGPSGLHPDPARMGFLQADPAFTDSFSAAWSISHLADTDACVLWSVTLERGTPANAIVGSSMAAALAVALDDLAPRHQLLRQLRPRRLDPRCAVTAGLDGDTLTPVTGYGDKLAAAQKHSLRVIVAAAGCDAAIQSAPHDFTDRVLGAHTVGDAIRHTRTRLNYKLWAAVLIVVLGITAVTGTVLKFAELREESARAQARAHASLFASVSQLARDRDPATARQIALAAYRTHDGEDTRSALLDSTSTNAPIQLATKPAPLAFIDDGPQLATTPDGDLLALGRDDGTVDLARVTETGVIGLPSFAAGGGHIRALALSGDQRWILTAGQTRTSLWDIANPATPTRLADLDLTRELPWSVAFSPDQPLLVLGTQNGQVLRWNLTDPAHPAPLPALAVAGGQHVNVAVSDRAVAAAAPVLIPPGTSRSVVQIWDTSTPEITDPVFTESIDPLRGAYVRSISFTADGTTLMAGLDISEVLRWRIGADLARPEPLAAVRGDGVKLHDAILGNGGEWLLTAGADQRIRIRDLTTGEDQISLTSPMPFRLRLLRHGQSLAVIGFDSSLQVYDLPGAIIRTAPRTLIRVPAAGPNRPSASALLPHLRALTVIDTPREQELRELEPTGISSVLAVSPDGRRAVTDDERNIQVWNIENPDTPVALGPPISTSSNFEVHSLTFGPDGLLAVARPWSSTVALWDVSGTGSPRPSDSIRYPRGFPSSLAFSSDGTLLAVGSDTGGTATVFDISDPAAVRVVAEVSGFDTDGNLMSLAVSSRKILAVGTIDGTRLYDLAIADSPREIPLTGLPNLASSVAFDQRGDLLASADPIGGRIHLWNLTDIDNPTKYATLTGGKQRMMQTFISFPADGVLAESATDGTLRQWRIDAAAEAERLCHSGTTPITSQTWASYLPGMPYVSTCPTR
ncbi:WD40 repeat domain-containing protein [Nocardia noduli]|uniref:WD40 repeat domain-containing protein n=1 Tax=Nocardia noduli TaxID=2815722 RepID=UPI001C22BB9C|nr:WD40 repeat domain-containing protein [Nocardia noduli]